MNAPAPSRLTRLAAAVGWSSFLAAGVLEALVFAVVDPADLRWFGSSPVELSAAAVYTASFALFWLCTSLAASLTLLLVYLPADSAPPQRHAPNWPR